MLGQRPGLWLASGIFLTLVTWCSSAILTPPYFNLAERKRITATATCGDEGPELYCKLVGANTENDQTINVIQGQVCDYCDLNSVDKNHPPEHAVDGTETWWQSPPLSRGMKYNEVNLTIDLGQEFHVAYVFVKMGNSPRPGLWALEKSSDYGKTYKPWQYFSASPSDCITYFGKESLLPITRDDSVICSTEDSKIVPLEGGEIAISLVNNRPSANMYFNSSVLQEWTRATNVRLRLIKTKTLLGHLMSVARQDPTVTRRYFYSIKDISIGGRCMCNGHAETCDIPDPVDPNKLQCRCQHHTCGSQCERCCPGFEQKAWRQSLDWKRFVCEPCNCFDHSNECHYDAEVDAKRLSLDIHGNHEGGGVCDNCQHNTEGINCNKCKPTFFRPYGKHWNQTDVCQPCECNYHYSTGNCAEFTGQCECKKEFTKPRCDSCSYGYYQYPLCKPCVCNLNGTQGNYCEPFNGECPCKDNYAGTYCEQCAEGFYKFPECEECACNSIGSLASACDQASGNCTCKNNFAGRTCDKCEVGFFNYPECKYCNCDASGTLPTICDAETGTCQCKDGFGGSRCDQCLPGYYSELRDRERTCVECKCSTIGSTTTSCDGSGKCTCLYNFAGKQCDQCSPGYYKYPECLACNCDTQGSIGVTCDVDGKCQCRGNFNGQQCNTCKEGFYNFPTCEECNCDPVGVIQSFAGCGSVPEGELCKCKDRVQGRICDECKPLFWNLQQYNPQGCQDCDCFTPGTQGGIAVCNTKSGQCTCKYSVQKRNCNECRDGSYNLTDSNVFGCLDCGCDIGGSVNHICDKERGQCVCRPRITGRRCDQPLKTHYFPTLHQYQYEVEDSFTPAGNDVRYGFDHKVFPNFSNKGYAVFSFLQNEVSKHVQIYKSSVYRMVMRYVNPSGSPISGKITITPENPSEVEQQFMVLFKPTTSPQFVTVSGIQGITPSPLVMNPGFWRIDIKIDKSLYLDYYSLIPAAYYEATILTQKVETACEIGDKGLCKYFGYPNIRHFDSVNGAGGFVSNNGERSAIVKYVEDKQQLNELQEQELPVLDKEQNEILLDFVVSKPGQYVMVIEYTTPMKGEGSDLVITARGSASQDTSRISLNHCPYTTLCRQVLLDDYNKVHVFNILDNNIGLTLKSISGTSAIKSVVAIPVSEWQLDFIKPSPICIKQDGKCLQSEFPLAPDSKKVEFESGNEEADVVKPWNIFDNNTNLLYLSDENLVADLNSKVPFPGQYVFIVQYYQPDFPASEMEVLIQNGQFYEGILPIKHCPSNSGCRSLVQAEDGTKAFSLTENFMLTVKEAKGKHVWLDYLLIVPENQFTDSLLKENRLDQTRQFISTCGNNHFFVNITEKGFCRDAIFSLTTDYNNGAWPCNCDYLGSLSFECEEFGGQCQCKPNVIGRKCEACKTGFYGFPDCKPCDCPLSATCEKDTGECICPSRVTGDKCDRCIPYTYGFDHVIGCVDCNCNSDGVEKNQLQCDLFNGTCQCKENVVGRTCDRCVAGHFDFPYCVSCDCDTRGTTQDICDQETAVCYCKSNAYSHKCDQCKEGTFDLQESNDAGCTKCFCFGKTTRCESAILYWAQITGLEEWSLVNILISQNHNLTIEQHTNPPDIYNATVLAVDLTNEESYNKIVYFKLSKDYLGNRLTSYGGYLEYEIFYTTTGLFGNAVSQADVILEGANTFLIHSGIEQPPSAENWTKKLKIVETEFTTLTGIPATREMIMTVLEGLQGIFIRATYWQPSVISRITAVSMEAAIEEYIEGTEVATSIEECGCPANYIGRSCEECAKGYYRSQSGPHGGFCVPCQCNGHASSCDINTGVCHNCKHNTKGDHCDQCVEGYHGNALMGTPNDCLICACPLPITSNNFATSCEVSPDGEHITCDCKPGYFGARCESCDSGFFGNPENPGSVCQPCECSGNINPEDPESCDTVTGDCLKCMNNTFGAACKLCQPGFYGDAVLLKDCQPCLCDKNGMERCDNSNGGCECKPGVIGDKCDRCEAENWGFESGTGCISCNCAEASDSKQCDDNTGQCKCKHGVTGKMCDVCAPGFWKYSPDGCIKCGCNTQYSFGLGCNAATGRCECLPGVVGDKCDRCPYRYVLIPDQGCFPCESCIHDLLNSTDDLHNLIDPDMVDFKNKASGYFTAQRLVYMSERASSLEDEVNLLNPDKIDLKPLTKKLDFLETETKNLDRKAEYGNSDAERTKKYAADLLDDCKKTFMDIEEAKVKSKETVDRVWHLANNLDTTESLKVDNAVAEAKQIYSDIQAMNLSSVLNATEAQQNNANEHFDKIQKFTAPVNLQSQEYTNLRKNITEFNNKINELDNYRKASQSTTDKAEVLNRKNRAAKVQDKIQNVNVEKIGAEQDLEVAINLLKNSTVALNDASISTANATNELNEGFLINQQVDKRIKERKNDALDELRNLLNQTNKHSTELQSKASYFNVLFEPLKNNTQIDDAVRGVTAYPNIVKEINNASEAAKEAVDAATKTSEQYKKIEKMIDPSKKKSDLLFLDAKNAFTEVQRDLKPKLDEATTAVQNVTSLNVKSNDANSAIELSLSGIPKTSLDPATMAAYENTNKINETLNQVNSIMNDISKSIPKSLEQAKILPKVVDEIIKSKTQIQRHLEKSNQSKPNITKLMLDVKSKQEHLDAVKNAAESQIDKLRKAIAMAKDLANRIKVGVKFEQSTTLELELPDNIDELETSTHVSAYFRTPKENGFLMYLGNLEGSKLKKTRSDDFMALEIENGYPVLTIDIGGGPQRIISDKFVSNDVWYQVIVDRTGNNVKLTIREELPDGDEKFHTTEKVLPGSNTIFNLDKDQSKLFVGGYPSGYKIQDDVRFSSFEGEMEDMVIGDKPVGLWNFASAQGNKLGSPERDKLINLKPSTGYRFNGNGFAIIDSTSYKMHESSDIELKFKTVAKDGLLFLAGKGESFLSIEMRDGKMSLQFGLNGEVLTIETPDRYNDGHWHILMATRYWKTGRLKVDGVLIGQSEVSGEKKYLEITNHLYFGGNPNKNDYKNVINTGFDGCIDDVIISTTPVDLSQNIQAFGVNPGCPEKSASIVSFDSEKGGYIRNPNISVSNYFQLSFKFKTTFKDGLMFYTTNRDQSAVISLALLNGSLVAISQKEKLSTSPVTYNDNQWHVVTVTHDENALKIMVDDYDYFSTDNAPPNLQFMYGDLFIGGVPKGYIITPGGSATRKQFTGCLGDATVNGMIINFANSTDKYGETLGRCHNDSKAVPSNLPLVPDDETKPIYEFETSPKKEQPPLEPEPSENEIKPTSSLVSPPSRPPYIPERKKPVYHYNEGCSISSNPIVEDDDPSLGYRFGLKYNSRIEFNQLPGRYKNSFDFSVEFNTTDEEGGLIFYAADRSHKDYVALYMRAGKIHFTFNCGSGAAHLMTEENFNDGQWHLVEFSRDLRLGKLVIDKKIVVDGQSLGTSDSMIMQAPFYYGGVENATTDIRYNLEDFYSPFRGCLKNLRMSNKPVINIQNKVNVISCNQQNEENGVFFQGKGYLKMLGSLKIGKNADISLEMKPRDPTGILLFVNSKKERRDHMIVELLNDTIIVSMDNGLGTFETSYRSANNKISLCDGKWHHIQIVKSFNVVSVALDGNFAEPTIGPGKTSTDTNSPLYVGGHPKASILRYSKSHKPYTGCMRNIRIKQDSPAKINLTNAYGDVLVGMCPKD